MLGVCTPDMHFVYVLLGWKGSIVDGRVLRDVISKRHGPKVHHTTRKDAQTAADIVEEIDAEEVATTNNLEEENNYHRC
ncbi:hypothetical protein Goshw_027386 [Gossypium schwendimanii]|uniref:Uncharacterized protein n=1 Tax=Gossypium schwendimanii TaxID=34291 RepID=A0A7J9NDI7_GOSSC|nr:hypothetical protein [Gossypium schwendimanii]